MKRSVRSQRHLEWDGALATRVTAGEGMHRWGNSIVSETERASGRMSAVVTC